MKYDQSSEFPAAETVGRRNFSILQAEFAALLDAVCVLAWMLSSAAMTALSLSSSVSYSQLGMGHFILGIFSLDSLLEELVLI